MKNKNGKRRAPSRVWGILGIAVGAAALLYYIAAGMTAGFSVSVLWVWLVAGVTLVVLGTADLLMRAAPRWVRGVIVFFRCVILVCVVWFFSIQALVFSGMFADCEAQVDYVLVAGAMVYGETPSTALLARIDAAYEYMTAYPDAVAVLCGGQGAGEDITEAECMRRVLAERGIPPERMILEDRSSTTAENMRNARVLIEDESASAVVVTSNFHVFRTVRIAEKSGWREVYGIAAPFRGIMVVHYMAREFLTVSVDTLRGNM